MLRRQNYSKFKPFYETLVKTFNDFNYKDCSTVFVSSLELSSFSFFAVLIVTCQLN